MKRVLGILICLVLILSFASCAKSPTISEDPVDVTPNMDALQIGVYTRGTTVEDGGYNQSINQGVLLFAKEHPDTEIVIYHQPDEAKLLEKLVESVEKTDIFVLTDPGFYNITHIIRANPDKFFIMIDSYPVDESGNAVSFDNVYAVTYAEQESGFYAGVAAALQSKTGIVSVICGEAVDSNINFKLGFEAGVSYASLHYFAEAFVLNLDSYSVEGFSGNYLGTFNDPKAGHAAAVNFIAQGVDVIAAYCGNSGDGIFEAATKSKDVYVIGCDVDQYNLGAYDGGNVTLTSAVKNLSSTVFNALVSISDGSFVSGNYILNTALGALKIVG